MHLMLDVETLGTDSRAVVLSLGSVFLSPGFPSFYMSFADATTPGGMDNINYQIDFLERSVSADTLAWWLMKAPQQSREATFCPKPVHVRPVYEGLEEWIEWIDDHLPEEQDTLIVWGNGAAFDQPIIESLMNDVGIRAPWKFWDTRCYRTMKALYKHIPRPVPEIPHHALHDALAQAKHLDLILKSLEAK